MSPPLPTRRSALKLLGLGAAALLAPRRARAAADPLPARGQPRLYRGADLRYLGLPVGGVGCGTLYLGGDGRLWLWDIFNCHQRVPADAHFAAPLEPSATLAQGFALRIGQKSYPLAAGGFADVAFRGEYPRGTVDYRDPAAPVSARLEAFSPFIPLDAADSSLPATVLHIAVTNESSHPIEAELSGWLENAVGLHASAPAEIIRTNSVARPAGALLLRCAAAPAPPPPDDRPLVVFADGSKKSFAAWSFPRGTHPEDLAAQRRRQSDPFAIAHRYVTAWLGGGDHADPVTLRLLVGETVARTATATPFAPRRLVVFDLAEFAGQLGRLEFENAFPAAPGHSGLGCIAFADSPVSGEEFRRRPDTGTLALALLDAEPADSAEPAAPGFPAAAGPVAQLRRRFTLGAGQSKIITFVLAWHFPHLRLGLNDDALGRDYARRFADAPAVAAYVAANFHRLHRQTHDWIRAWHTSSLPSWLLDRTFVSASTLATATVSRLATGRFFAADGCGGAPGAATDLWLHAQAPAYLFPELERDLRERTDLGLAFDAHTGAIARRAEFDAHPALDGQAGVILRTLREHQLGADGAFLRRVWPRVKLALAFLLARDPENRGLLDGPALSSLYLAALRAGEELARELGDADFAHDLRVRIDATRYAFERTYWNGDFFAADDGTCAVDQVLGQVWAHQLGLGRLLDETKTRSALRAIVRKNPPATAARPEYFLAAHLLAEGLVAEGLAVERGIHDRYDAAHRNPWNEIDSADHAARAMAGYAVFLAACGFTCHGPRGRLGFAPRLTPEDFSAAFTSAEGWGRFGQSVSGGKLTARLELLHGRLRLTAVILAPPAPPATVRATLDRVPQPATVAFAAGRAEVAFAEPLVVTAGQTLEIAF